MEEAARAYVKHVDVVAFRGEGFPTNLAGDGGGVRVRGQVHFGQVFQMVQKRFDLWNGKIGTVLGRGRDGRHVHVRSVALLVHAQHVGIRFRCRERLRRQIQHRRENPIGCAVFLMKLPQKQLPLLRVNLVVEGYSDHHRHGGTVGAFVVAAHVGEDDTLAVAIVNEDIRDFGEGFLWVR